MWEEFRLPYIFERMQNFSIPVGDEILIESYDGKHLVRLLPKPTVTDYEEDHWEPGWDRFEMLGIDGGGEPILINGLEQRLSLDPAREVLDVVRVDGRVVQRIEFSDMSGDWGIATYSFDGKWLVIGVPYDLFVYRWCGGPLAD